MTVIDIGDIQTADGAKFPGMVIEASREELQEVAGNILYKEVSVRPVTPTKSDLWGEMLEGLVRRLCEVDQRVRAAKASRKYSRAEVLAMLDEIDPEGEKKGGAK